MDKNYLLTCLAEECCELAQAATKAIRFGITDVNPSTGDTNLEAMHKEYCDVVAILRMLNSLDVHLQPDMNLVDAKVQKVKNMYHKYHRSDANE